MGVQTVHSIELIENYYKGEKYEPEGQKLEERYPYSSSYIAMASAGQGGPVRPEDAIHVPQARMAGGGVDGFEGRGLTFSGLMHQLGLALRNQLNVAGEVQDEPRNLDANTNTNANNDAQDDDLLKSGGGEANNQQTSHPPPIPPPLSPIHSHNHHTTLTHPLPPPLHSHPSTTTTTTPLSPIHPHLHIHHHHHTTLTHPPTPSHPPPPLHHSHLSTHTFTSTTTTLTHPPRPLSSIHHSTLNYPPPLPYHQHTRPRLLPFIFLYFP
ncbi:hypothetical protein Pcinc_010438 [Petrolisthes cinctipes]|uniref:Uncharacterized protein n=1 Tax=Petrolisthes cinctipes TaxID=88211 RepID=A0AAE1G4U0_PETCI|nr:hypothetical protein Pcinc_010438 [Petrolisthes cinctipes]